MKDFIWIEEKDARAVHGRVIVAHGGTDGIRDTGLLQSALARPLQRHAYSGTADIIELAAAYTAGIIQNHPFLDGNKRTGFVIGILFLELNGHRFTAPEEMAAKAVIALAAGTMNEENYKVFIQEHAREKKEKDVS